LENGKRNTLIKAKTCFRYQFTFETNITDARSVIASKVAEEVVVERYVKPVILKIVDGRQFGTVPWFYSIDSLENIIKTAVLARIVSS
jgi:hypothetical protein